MQRIILCFLFAVSVLSAKAWLPDSIAAKRTISSKHLWKQNRDRIVFDFFGSNWIHNKENGFQTRWYSRGMSISFYYDFPFKKSRFSFAPGIGWSMSHIYNNSQMTADTNGIRFTPIEDFSENYRLNRVGLHYIDIPLELRFRTKPDKVDQMWKFAIGFKTGVRVDSHTRQVTRNPRRAFKESIFPDFQLLRAGPTFRFGYSFVSFTAYYGVLNVFKSGRGPKANEFTVGISINGL